VRLGVDDALLRNRVWTFLSLFGGGTRRRTFSWRSNGFARGGGSAGANPSSTQEIFLLLSPTAGR